MSPAELDTLRNVIDVMREKGVVELDYELEYGRAGIKLGPLEPTERPEPAQVDENKCRCGHPVYAHDPAGLCIEGCEPSTCVDPKALESLEAAVKSLESKK